MDDSTKSYRLKRELSLFDVTVAGVGIILGAGIYALIGVAAGEAGNATWLSFLISAIVAVFTGYSYAELSSIYKTDSGEYNYCKDAFSDKTAWFVALLMISASLVTAAVVALGFAGYIVTFLDVDFLLAAIGIIVLMSVINYIGIRTSSRFNTVATALEFFGLLLIIILGIPKWGTVDLMEMPMGLKGVFQAGALVFFAFLGFETIIKLREETKNADKNIPKAIMLSIFITAVVYVLVSISAVSSLNHQELATSSGPLASVAAASFGPMAFTLLAIIALFSTSNTILLTVVTNSRMIYGMAKQKSLPAVFGWVQRKRRTPYIAIIGVMVLSILLTLPRDIELVANIANVFLFIIFIFVNWAAIVLRYKTDKKRPFRMPLNIGKFPVLSLLGILSSAVLMVFAIINLSA
ncbi:APC family permease [Pseudomonadota bacterium]